MSAPITRPWPVKTLLLISVAAGFALVPGLATSLTNEIGPTSNVNDHDECVTASTTLPTIPDDYEAIDAILQELYAVYADIPGLIDVYFYPEQETMYQVTFEGEVPAEAFDRNAPYPVSIVAVDVEFQELDPGTVPSVADIRCAIGPQPIRPGNRVTSPIGVCTLSFVFKDADTTYVGTAGHCGNPGQAAWVDGAGNIGDFVFSTGSGGVGNDFALIEVKQSYVVAGMVTAEMCTVGGPTSPFVGFSISGDDTIQTGHGGGVVGGPPRPKAGVGLTWGATSFTWVGSSAPGDSGSAIRLETGDALGTVTHLNLLVPVQNYGTRLSHGLSLAASGGYPGLVLQTVPWTHP